LYFTVENALNDVESKKKELENLERRYHALSQTVTDRSKVNTNVLSMSLNGIVDTPPNQGVPMYRRAFLGADYMAVNPDKAGIIKRLEVAIDELVSRPLLHAEELQFTFIVFLRSSSSPDASSCTPPSALPRWPTSTILSSAVGLSSIPFPRLY
jgi:hypothetical protein